MTMTELLAPAGDYECFLAAIHAGADAVYLGGRFSARAYAKNFSEEELLRAIDVAHLYGKKVYLTLNTVMKENEISGVLKDLLPLYSAGLDAVIVQDAGLIRALRESYPLLPVHASTQLSITDSEGVRVMRELQVKRVVLARELSLAEIERIHTETEMELECFVHGALCYSYSGKCLLSGLIGGRSGNRGRCAQPCRLPYQGEYPLSCKDICTLQMLPKLIRAGITSFKIEGRMKNPDYVAGVVGIYRKYLDLCLQDSSLPFAVADEDMRLLLTLYTRSGHSSGYYEQRNGREMITMTSPAYVRADAAVADAAFRRFTGAFRKRDIDLSVSLKKGVPITLTASSGASSVTVCGAIVEAARLKPLSQDDIRKQLSKLGGTEFRLRELRIDQDADVFVPVSKLNELRRNAVDTLLHTILEPFRRAGENASSGRVSPDLPPRPVTTPLLHVQVLTLAQLMAALSDPHVDLISVPFREMLSLPDRIRDEIRATRKSCRLLVQFPLILRSSFLQREEETLLQLMREDDIAGFLVDQWEGLGFLCEHGYEGLILADLHLYACNRDAVLAIRECGASVTTVPVELNRKELLLRAVCGEDCIVYGRLPAMVSAQCVQKTMEGCTKQSGFLELTDRYHVKFPVFHDCSDCVNIVYNSVPLWLHNEREFLKRLQPASLRVIFTVEEGEEAERILTEIYRELFLGEAAMPVSDEYTKGHLNRGVE